MLKKSRKTNGRLYWEVGACLPDWRFLGYADRGQHRKPVIRDWFAFDEEEIESIGRWVRHSNQHPFLTFYGPLVVAALTFTVSGFIHPLLAFVTTLPAYYVSSRLGERIVRWRAEKTVQ